MSKATPGPWRIGDAGGTVFGPPNGNQSPETVAHVIGVRRRHNGALIAAAPELRDALRETLRALEQHLDDDTAHAGLKHRDHLCPCNQNEVMRARAALAKAEG